MSNMVLWGANELPWPRDFQIGVTLDAFLRFLKSGALRGHCLGPLKGVQGAPYGRGSTNYFYPFTVQGCLSVDRTFLKKIIDL